MYIYTNQEYRKNKLEVLVEQSNEACDNAIKNLKALSNKWGQDKYSFMYDLTAKWFKDATVEEVEAELNAMYK